MIVLGPSEWTLYFGNERAPGRPVNVTFYLYTATDTAPTPARGTVVAEIDGAVLSFQRLPG